MIRVASALVLVLGLVVGLAAPAAAADGVRVGPLTVVAAWARATPPTAKTGAAYLTIRNDGDAADALVATAVGTDVAARAELHTHVHEDGVMRMRPIDAVDLPAGGTATMAPGGDHVMLMGLAAPLVEGARFPLRLEFEGAGRATVEVRVMPPDHRPAGTGAGHGMGN